MKKFPILAIVSSSHKPAAVADLSRVAVDQGWSVTLTKPDAADIEQVLRDSDRAIFRVSPKNYPIYESLLPMLSGEFHDQLASILTAFDKIETNIILSQHQIPTPRTWIIQPGVHYDDKRFVVKIRRGNQGLGVGLIGNNEALQVFIADYPNETDFLAQEFILEAASGDKRLFVVGGRVVASMRRQSRTDDFRANIHLGGEGIVYIPTAEEVDIAIKSLDAFGLEYAGVDIIDSDRGPLVLEVNPSPGFAIAAISGIDVAKAVFNYIIRSQDD